MEVIQAASGHRLPPPARPNVWVEITEEPSSNGVRYRYASEGRASHLHGVRSTDAQPTFPAIRLAGPDVAAVGEFVVLISLVTDETAPPYRPHPHKLIGDHCTEGFYQRAFHADDAGAEVAFESLGIQCMKRDENAASLRLREVRRINPYKSKCVAVVIRINMVLLTLHCSSGPPRAAPPHQPRDTYDKNTVRLCFQVYVRMAAGGGGGERHRLRPVVSRPVRDKRDNLVIYKISHASGTARGRTHMILLCERVRKEDIDVEFRELDPHTREPVWMALGEFDESDVHRQVAIALRTPPYRDPNTAVPRTCAIRLRNRRTQATSEDLRFEYTPEPADGGRSGGFVSGIFTPPRRNVEITLCYVMRGRLHLLHGCVVTTGNIIMRAYKTNFCRLIPSV